MEERASSFTDDTDTHVTIAFQTTLQTQKM